MEIEYISRVNGLKRKRIEKTPKCIYLNGTTISLSGYIIIGSYNSIRGNDNKVIGNGNELMGNGNEVKGDGNRLIFGSRNRFCGNGNHFDRSKSNELSLDMVIEIPIDKRPPVRARPQNLSDGLEAVSHSDIVPQLLGELLLFSLIQDHLDDPEESRPVKKRSKKSSKKKKVSLPDKEKEEKVEFVEGQTCIVCMTRNINTVLVDCGHQIMCIHCTRKIGRQENPQCPVCKKSFKQAVKVFKS